MKIINLIVFNLVLTISSCSSHIHNNGFNFENTNFNTIKVGKSNINNVRFELGSPTNESNFGAKTYYYIERKVQKVAFFDPKILEQKILVIEFSKDNVVSNITELALDDAKNVIFSKQLTELKGNDLTILQQFLTNIGKFKPKK